MKAFKPISKFMQSGGFVLTMFLSVAPQVWAAGGGASDGGGGDGIVCPRPQPQAYLADYFLHPGRTNSDQFIRALTPILFVNARMDESAAVNYLEAIMFEYLKTSASADLRFEAERLERINFLTYVFVASLPELEDDGIVIPPQYVQAGCRKQQLAIQDFNTFVVQVAQPIYAQLNILDKALLRFHERYITLEKKPGELTPGVREKTMRLFLSAEFNNYLIQRITNQRAGAQNLLRAQDVP